MKPKFTTVFTTDLHWGPIQCNIPRGVVNLVGTKFDIILPPTPALHK